MDVDPTVGVIFGSRCKALVYTFNQEKALERDCDSLCGPSFEALCQAQVGCGGRITLHITITIAAQRDT